MVDMVGDPDRIYQPSARMPPTFAQALAEGIAADIAAITPPHPEHPEEFELRAGITAGMTQIFYFQRERKQKHKSAWEPCLAPTVEQESRIRSLLKLRELKRREGPQGYILLALSSED